jgi:hypothetical protein
MARENVTACFGCHSTAAVHGNAFHPEDLKAGVHCESCHAQAHGHMEAVTAGYVKNAALPHLAERRNRRLLRTLQSHLGGHRGARAA